MSEPSSPAVSIVLPTFNRADVLPRAIDSVRKQTFDDWELLIVDDGSTDGTVDAISAILGLDERIRVLRQENAGVYTARNHGLAKARGRWLTFLDSDDEWAPHFLDVTTAFLRHHPDEHFVTTEFWEDWGSGPAVKHDLYEIGEQYPAIARAIGSRRFDLPPGETDDYLRVYSSREAIGDWGREIVVRAGFPDAKLYRGRIFEHMRYGYLNWLPITVLTRHALDTVGPFTTHTRSAADYRFLCRLARAFPANMLALPSATKFDRAAGAKALKQDHLAKGAGAYRFEVNKLGFFDELFATPGHGDAEIETLRCHYALDVARAALRVGNRALAAEHFAQAARLQRRLWMAYPGLAFARAVPSDDWAGAAFRAGLRAFDIGERVVKGELTAGGIVRRMMRA